MKQRRFITFLSLMGAFYNVFASAQVTNNQIIQGPFKTDLFPRGKIYFQKTSDINRPVNFILEYQQNGKDIKDIIDKYDVNGGDPEIVSVFFAKVHNKKYIFTIIKWRDYHAALQMNGYDYQIYAYTINNLGKLGLDKRISNDPNLSGNEGEFDGKDVFFKYKTAVEAKHYLKKKYH